MPDRRVVLLFGDRLAQIRLAEALRGHATLRVSERPEEVIEAASTSPAEVATVVFFSPARLAEASRAVERIRACAPDHAIIGYVDPRTLSSRFILDMGRVGLTDLVLRDIDDSRAVLLRVVEHAAQRDTALQVAAHLCEHQSRDVRLLVQYACRHLREPLDATSIAAALGVNRRTLYHRLAAVGSPGPRELVGWCRVAFIAWQLSHTRLPLATIAVQLDVPSWRSLSSLVRRYLGMGTNRLRRLDPFPYTLARFRAEFAPRAAAPAAHVSEHEHVSPQLS